MRKVLIWIGVVVVAAGLGVGAAAVVGRLASALAFGVGGQRLAPFTQGQGTSPNFWMGPMMMGRGFRNRSATGQRISMDKAVDLAKQYAASYGKDLQVSEVMEFSENFYAVVKEAGTGRGAFELIIDPYTGAVYPEMGPNMMWNSKYSPMGGMMGGFQGGDNTVSLDQAAQAAQKYLDANLPGTKLETDGVSFYGHYTFDYQMNDKIAGMLSVNGVTGEVWLHTWHGDFIQELEVE
jgi:hypothetical protein